MPAKHVIVSGRVQGVYFRAWTKEQADRLGLDGWVRNRADGRVEAVISGSESQVQEMLALLDRGSPPSKVEHVAETAWNDEVAPGFEIKPTA